MSQISAHPLVWVQSRVQRPWALFCETTVYVFGPSSVLEEIHTLMTLTQHFPPTRSRLSTPTSTHSNHQFSSPLSQRRTAHSLSLTQKSPSILMAPYPLKEARDKARGDDKTCNLNSTLTTNEKSVRHIVGTF